MPAASAPVLRSGLIVFTVALICGATSLHGQSDSPSAEYIAFRVDAERVIATVLLRDVNLPQVRKGLSPPPVARFGYEYFEPPDYWGDPGSDHKAGDRWFIHTSPGQVLEATVERRVGGYMMCAEAVGVLLRVAPQQTNAGS